MRFVSLAKWVTWLLVVCAAGVHADIVIGQSSPLTGVAGETGSNLALGAKVYFDDVNAKGGISGQKIKHIVLDDRYEAGQTLANAEKLIGPLKALALVNFYGTGNIGELIRSKQLDRGNIGLVGVYTGASSVRSPFTPHIFHTRAGYSEEVEKIVSMLSDLGMNTVGVLYQDDPFGEAGLEACKTALSRHKMTLAGSATYPKLTDDVAGAAQSLAKINPQAVIMIAITKPAAAFVSQFRKLGATSQLFNISVANFEEIVRIDGANVAHGLGISQVFPFPYQTKLRVVREYLDDMKQYSPGVRPSYASMEGFINAKVLVEALRRAGKNPTRDSIQKALVTLKDFDLGDFHISYGEDNRLGSHHVELTMINQNGELAR